MLNKQWVNLRALVVVVFGTKGNMPKRGVLFCLESG